MSRSALQREAQRSKQHFLGRGAGPAPLAPSSSMVPMPMPGGAPAAGYHHQHQHLMSGAAIPLAASSYAVAGAHALTAASPSPLPGVYYPHAPSAAPGTASAASYGGYYSASLYPGGASGATAGQYYYGYNYSTAAGAGFDAQAYYSSDASTAQQAYPYYGYAASPPAPLPGAAPHSATGSGPPPAPAQQQQGGESGGEGQASSTADILSSYGLSHCQAQGQGADGAEISQPADVSATSSTSGNNHVSYDSTDVSSNPIGGAPIHPPAPLYGTYAYALGDASSPPLPPVPTSVATSMTMPAPHYDLAAPPMAVAAAGGGVVLHSAPPVPLMPPPPAPAAVPDAASLAMAAAPASAPGASASAASVEGGSQRSPVFPIYGNAHTFNLNPLLHTNIMQCDYFRALFQLKTYHEVVDEIYSTVRHLAPWQTGTTRAPSSAFCLLLKLLVMGVTHNQVHGLLATDDCPYVRGMGLLMLRYICAPKDLYGYFEPYLEDDSVFSPSHDEAEQMTMGAYAIKLLTDMQYFGTTLPRIPVPIERKIKVLLLLLKEKQTRRVEQFMKYYDGPHLEKGAAVQAIYSDEENEPAWYAGVIQRKASLDEVNDHNKRRSASRGGAKRHRRDDRSSSRGRDHRDRDRSRRRSRSRSRTRSRSRDRSGRGGGEAATRDLMAEVLKNEREASEAVGRNYAHRPASYKGSLSLKQERYTVRKKSRSRSPLPRSSQAGRGTSSSSSAPPASADISQQASMAASREYQEKMKKLIDRYGDASAK